MKKPIIIILILCTGCMDKRFDPIAYYEQNIFDTQIDLSFKGLEYQELGAVTAQDSLNLFLPLFNQEINEKLDYLENDESFYIEMLNVAKYGYKNAVYPEMKRHYKQQIAEYERKVKEDEQRTAELIEIYKTDCKGTYLETIKSMIDKWQSDTAQLLGWRVKASYQITNPLLNVEQQLTKEYLLNPDKTKVIASISGKDVKEIFFNLYDSIM